MPPRYGKTKQELKKPMANKSAPGILTDCKQLLALTYDIINSLSNRDRVLVGDALMAANIGMVREFCLAYKRADEHYAYDDGKTAYDLTVKGAKLENVDRCLAHFEQYKALWEFIMFGYSVQFANADGGPEKCLGGRLHLERMNETRRRTLERMGLEMLGKIETGLSRWRSSVNKQVALSRKDRAQLSEQDD